MDNYFNIKDLLPEAPKDLLTELELVKFSKKTYDVDKIATSIKFFRESYYKIEEEIRLRHQMYSTDSVKQRLTDKSFYDHVINNRQQFIPLLIEGKSNDHLDDKTFFYEFIKYELCANWQRLINLENLLLYYKNAIRAITDSEFKYVLI